MKTLLVLACLLASGIAQATSPEQVFRANTPLPLELQVEILKVVREQCPRALDRATLVESATNVTEKAVDQGQTDLHFATEFAVKWYFDGTHPMNVRLDVESAAYGISNPGVKSFEVLSVKGEGSLCE